MPAGSPLAPYGTQMGPARIKAGMKPDTGHTIVVPRMFLDELARLETAALGEVGGDVTVAVAVFGALHNAVANLESRGVVFARYDGMEQDAQGVYLRTYYWVQLTSGGSYGHTWSTGHSFSTGVSNTVPAVT